ncbi:MAG: S-layer homology domain-containing protein [Clostridiales bacterium]|nr:S-layer homology domain-containing protein [Clostridiales bacterium]
MKSLNRTLSLVLVLVMVLGMFGIAGATFTDAATVQYTEAVEVMAGIGAINGYADGSFKPTGTITREEAAKMITYAILGSDVASRLSVGATGFKDVDAGRWSAPFISYLVGKGIINGMGDGTFAPTANVTGYQLAKMMLCAAGYGAKGEFTGPGWELAVAVAANKTVFVGDKSVDHAKAATREEAALYVFNGITNVPKTSYNKLFDEYKPVEIGAYNDLNSDGFRQIAEEVYTKLAKSDDIVDGRTGFYWTLNGKEISSFVPSDKALASSTDGTKIETLTNPASPKYIKAKEDTTVKYYYNNFPIAQEAAIGEKAIASHKIGDYVMTPDGKLYTMKAAIDKDTVIDADTHFNAEISYDGLVGVVINFLDSNNNGKYDAISIVKKTVSQVSDNIIVKTTGSLTTVAIPGVTNTAVNANTISYPSDLKKGDAVLFYTSADGVTYVEKAKVVVGTMTGYVDGSKQSVVIDGKEYKASDLINMPMTVAAGSTPTSVNGKVDSTIKAACVGVANTAFFLDNSGSVCHVYVTNAPIANDKVLFVADAEKGTPFSSAKAMAVFADGTAKPINVAKVGKRSATPIAVSDAAEADALDNGKLAKNTFYTYTVATDGSYTLNAVEDYEAARHFKAVDADTSSANAPDTFGTIKNASENDEYATITKGKADFLTTYKVTATPPTATETPQGIIANNATVFLVYNAATSSYKVYTGISNVPNITVCANTAKIDVMLNTNGYASLVVVGNNVTSASTDSGDYIFAIGSPQYVHDAQNPYYLVKAVVNGETKDLKVDEAISKKVVVGAGVFMITAKNGEVITGAESSGGRIIAADSSMTKLAVSGGTMSVYDNTGDAGAYKLKNSYVLGSSVKCFVLNTTNKTFEPVSDPTSLPMMVYGNTFNLQVVGTTDTNHTATYVFITIA